MKLTQEQLNKLSSKLKIAPSCPNCGFNGQMSLQPDEYQLTSVEHSGSSYNIGGPMSFMPLAEVLCPQCGYVRLFNLKILGIV